MSKPQRASLDNIPGLMTPGKQAQPSPDAATPAGPRYAEGVGLHTQAPRKRGRVQLGIRVDFEINEKLALIAWKRGRVSQQSLFDEMIQDFLTKHEAKI